MRREFSGRHESKYRQCSNAYSVAPSGEIVARSSGEEDEVITARIDLAMGQAFRDHVFNFAKHRNPQHYKLIVERTGAGDPLPTAAID